MKLEASNLWIEGPFYMDFDALDQLRIVGPGNHLFLGLVGIYKKDIKVNTVSAKNGKLFVNLTINKINFFLPDPVVRNIRRVRRLTEVPYEFKKTFQELINQHSDLEPNYIYFENTLSCKKIFFRRRFSRHWYGTTFNMPINAEIVRNEKRRGFEVSGCDDATGVDILITAESDIIYRRKVKKVLEGPHIELGVFDDRQELVANIMDRTQAEIEHLITYDKTSGFEYGTIFPRDWMEAADLGADDFPQEIIDYMYKQALKFVTKKGVGWHEDIVGEFKYERLQANAKVIVRHMIDIEPRYILGLRVVSSDFIKENKKKLKRVADYVLAQARKNSVITFKKKRSSEKLLKGQDNWDVGNWRDSISAYKSVKQPIAPFDVNVVYYPAALRLIKEFAEVLDVEALDIEDLILKWDKNKEKYEFINDDGLAAASLAIYDIKKGDNLVYKALKVNNLDEAFRFVYLSPEEGEAVSFAKRLISEVYFFTPAGPTLVDKKSGYTTKDYHGEVIWIKQTAFTVLGLVKALEFGRQKGWSKESLEIIKNSIIVIAESTILATAVLRGVPELYYYNIQREIATYYDLQEGIEAQMSKIQLWSAVGIRQIIRSYYTIIKE